MLPFTANSYLFPVAIFPTFALACTVSVLPPSKAEALALDVAVLKLLARRGRGKSAKLRAKWGRYEAEWISFVVPSVYRALCSLDEI